MVATIHEPTLSRSAAAPVIEQELRTIYASVGQQSAPIQRTVLDDLKLAFFRSPDGVHFSIFQAGKRVMAGDLDPRRKSHRAYSNNRFDPYHWERGRWEENFGVPMDSYDPHWDDRIPPVLVKAIRKAASSPGSGAAKQVLNLMDSYADSRFEGFIESAVDGSEYAADSAGTLISMMRGLNMAAMVPLTMWVNGAASLDVLQAYSEAHYKLGVRRRHLRRILGTGDRVADFLGFAAGADALERSIEILRAMPGDEAVKLIDTIASDRSPLVQQIFPEGLEAFLQRFLSNPNPKLQQILAQRRSGLFS